MINRFYSFEDAAIHAGVMRSHGHAASVLDEAVGSLYGPVLTNGYRVWVSDEPVTAEEDSETPEEPADSGETTTPNPLMDALRVIFGALLTLGLLAVGIGVIALVVGILLAIRLLLVEGLPQGSRSNNNLVTVLLLLGSVALVVCSGPFMERLNRSFRDLHSPLGWTFRGMVILYVATELVFLVIAFFLRILGGFQE